MTRRIAIAGCSAVVLGILGCCGLCLLLVSSFFTRDNGVESAAALTSGALRLAGPEPTSVPLVIRYGRPLARVMVNDEGPFLFLLDTGATFSVVSKRLAGKLNMRPLATKQHVYDALGTKTTYRFYEVGRISVGAADATRVWATVQDFASSQAGFHPALEGILGFDLFRSVLMTIDYEQERLVLRAGTLDASDDAEVLPYELTRGTPTVRLTVGGEEGEFLLDSGSNGSIQVPNDLARLLPLDRERFSQPATLSGGKRAQTVNARLVQSLAIGGIEIQEPLIGWIEGHENARSLIGGLILKYFAITFDPASEVVYLEPRVQGPVRQNGIRHTGLTYGVSNKGLRIRQIAPGSPASQLDLQIGDHVVAVDGREVRLDGQGFGPWDFRSLTEERDELLYRIRRGDSEFTVAVPVSIALP